MSRQTKRTKIVCTLGPASSTEEILIEMIESGMDVARLNFSHGDHDYHQQMFGRIRALAKDRGRPIAILQDLQGPKIRVGRFKQGFTDLSEGEEFVLTTDDVEGDDERVSTTYPQLPEDVGVGDILLLDDGLLKLRAVEVSETDVRTVVEIGGRLKNNKGINLPTAAVSAPSLTEKDQQDLMFGLELGVDYVALSFVRSALDIHQMRAMMPRHDHGAPIQIISKIEKPQAIVDLDNIIAVSDGIMIARGDLGVELPPQKVPMLQKMAIRRANALGRLSITATQMLESMTENARPTRAEASDVANAVLDGTDAVMLSGETASGKYPVRAVRMMSSIIEEVEQNVSAHPIEVPSFIGSLRTFPNAVARAATTAANELNVKGIVVLTQSGSTAKLMMTYRPTRRIIACAPSERVCNQMAGYWGVEPHVMEMQDHTDALLTKIDVMLKRNEYAKAGDEIIVVMGSPVMERAETNMIKFHRVS